MSLMLNPGTWDDPGLQLFRAQTVLAQAQELIAKAEQMRGRTINGEAIMSQALWCDGGDHAFSARDPRREHWQRTIYDSDGQAVEVPWDVCGEHATASQPRAAVTDGS